VSNRTKCIASCKGCIAASTQNCADPEDDGRLFPVNLRHLRKGLKFAERCGATHAILTGKADPLQEAPPYIFSLI